MHHESRSIISIGDDPSDTVLLRQAMNKRWDEMAEGLDISQFSVFVGDGEPGLANAFCKGDTKFQYCHEHAKRDLAYFMWQDGLSKKQYKEYSEEFCTLLCIMQNSTAKHMRDKNWKRLTWRIGWVKKEVKALAAKLSSRELHSSAAFLMNHRDHLVTAAELAIVGIAVPWTTNIVERLMQEKGKRTKKKGMYWSEKGAENILKMVLKRYFRPRDQRKYIDIFQSTKMVGIKS